MTTRPKCTIRLEYFLSDNDDIRNELNLLESIGWEVLIDNDFTFSTVRQEFCYTITLVKSIDKPELLEDTP